MRQGRLCSLPLDGAQLKVRQRLPRTQGRQAPSWHAGGLNESWPLSDKAGGTLAASRTQPTPIGVEVRIEWAQDGEEWLHGRAHRRTKSHAFVRFQDPRSLTGCVVRARDVQRP